jgi:hypothetical protein
MGMGDKDKMDHAVPQKLQALIVKAVIAGTPIPNGKGGQLRAPSLEAVCRHEGSPEAMHAYQDISRHGKLRNNLINPATFQGDVLTFTCCTDREFNRCITGSDTPHGTQKIYHVRLNFTCLTCRNKVSGLQCGRLRAEVMDDQGWFKMTGLTPKSTKLGKVSKEDELAQSHLATMARDGNWSKLPCFRCGELCPHLGAFARNQCTKKKKGGKTGSRCGGSYADKGISWYDGRGAHALVKHLATLENAMT